jgi:hypothetical protein
VAGSVRSRLLDRSARSSDAKPSPTLPGKVANVTETAGWRRSLPPELLALSFPAMATCLTAIRYPHARFLFFTPISYGLPLTNSGFFARTWLDSWR